MRACSPAPAPPYSRRVSGHPCSTLSRNDAVFSGTLGLAAGHLVDKAAIARRTQNSHEGRDARIICERLGNAELVGFLMQGDEGELHLRGRGSNTNPGLRPSARDRGRYRPMIADDVFVAVRPTACAEQRVQGPPSGGPFLPIDPPNVGLKQRAG